jgi:hypothetical protein
MGRKTSVRWLLFEYKGLELVILSKLFKTKELAEKARQKYPDRVRRKRRCGSFLIGGGAARVVPSSPAWQAPCLVPWAESEESQFTFRLSVRGGQENLFMHSRKIRPVLFRA